MKQPIHPGEVWIADLGIAAKVRPVLILTSEPGELELALVTFVSHTTAVRGDNRWEVCVPKHWLKDGAFHLQQVHTVAKARLQRRLGALTVEEFSMVKAKLSQRLGISADDIKRL